MGTSCLPRLHLHDTYWANDVRSVFRFDIRESCGGQQPGCSEGTMGDVRRGSDVSILAPGAASTGSWPRPALYRSTGVCEASSWWRTTSSSPPRAWWRADIRAGTITLGGRARGNLTAPGDVCLSPGSQVHGDVHARNVVVHGVVTGDIVGQDRVELAQGARLDGSITCRLLVVAEGAVFCGRYTMGEHSKRPTATA